MVVEQRTGLLKGPTLRSGKWRRGPSEELGVQSEGARAAGKLRA